MGTVHRDACEQAASEWMKEEDKRICLTDYLWKLQTGFFDPDYECVFIQRFLGKPDFANAYAFMQLHGLMCTGKLASFKVHVGKCPMRDSQEEINNAILQNIKLTPWAYSGIAVEPEFDAVFAPGKGGNADDDGLFTWLKPVTASVIVDPPDKTALVIIEPSQLPLEVGYTEATKTLIHVNGEGGIARWPYGSKDITVLVRL